jgi:hypothetical protein
MNPPLLQLFSTMRSASSRPRLTVTPTMPLILLMTLMVTLDE